MNKSPIAWLYSELPALVAAGVLSPEAADRLRSHYGPIPEATERRGAAVIVCGILGALLIGLGIVLVLAHNWAELTRPMRTAIALTPLVAGQCAAAFALIARRGSVAWRESCGAFLVCAIAVSIALIGQTYHIPGNLESFLFTCMLLSIPLAYLLDASLVAILYLAVLPFWTGMHLESRDGALAFFPMALLAAPYAVASVYRRPQGVKAFNLALFGAIALGVGLPMAVAPALDEAGLILVAALTTAYYLVHTADDAERPAAWTWPFRIFGTGGQIVLAIILTYDDAWRELAREFSLFPDAGDWLEWLIAWSAILALLALSAALLLRAVLARRYWKIVPGILPALVVFCLAYSSFIGDPFLPVVLFNAFILALGIAAIAYGIQENRLMVVNWGILIVAALVTARFFDSDMSFVIRGIAFIVLGCAFLAVNVLWLRKKGNAPGAAT